MILVRAGSGKNMLCRLLIAGLVLFGATAAAVAGPSADSAGKPCVAILEAEVVGKMPGDERKALAGWLDTLLTESLAKRKDFVTVDRQALDKVLAERAAKAGGLTKIDAKDVSESLRPFWSAGILICPIIRQASPKEAAPGKMIVSVEAVLAQTGQLLASLYVQADGKNEQGFRKALAGKLGAFWPDVRTHLRRNSGKPLVDISGKLTSKITRLQWMVDDLRDAAEARVALAQNVAPLVRRQPLNTKEERLLRVMGLSAAKAGDKAAGLGPVPDIRLLMELTETVKIGVSFTKTPISLKLSLQRAKAPAITTAIKSEVGQWETCRKDALVWIDTRVRALSNGGPTAKADDEARARKLAREELATIKQWTALSPSNQCDLPRQVRRLILDRALRAAHLDPTSETAAYLVALHVDSLYEGSGYSARPLACYDRAIAECRRYLDRFDQKVVDHHREVLDRLGRLAACAAYKTEDHPPGRKDIFPVPNELKCHYVRIYVRAWAEHGYLGEIDKRYDNSNSFTAFGYNLVHNLIPNCPQKELDQEYEYWKNFWDKKVRTIEKRRGKFKVAPVPWEFVEATFAARRKDARGVRAALQQLARVCPKSKTSVWGGDSYKEYIVPVYLKKAGDPQWKSWQPEFQKAEPIKISLDVMTSFLYRLRPTTPGPWSLSNVPVIPMTEFVVPQRVLKTGRKEGSSVAPVEGLFTAGGDIWLITPATWLSSARGRNRLFAAPLKPTKAGKVLLEPVEIHWPKYDLPPKPILTCSYVGSIGNNLTVWLGTKAHGLARFNKTGGKWTGRWYTTRNGMPTNGVTRISTCRADGKQAMLLVDQNTRRMFKEISPRYSGPQTMVWTLDPGTGDVKLLFDGSKGNMCINWTPAATLTDGRKVLLELLAEDVYGNPDIAQVKSIQKSGYAMRICPISTTRDAGKNGKNRIWQNEWNKIWEICDKTLNRLAATSPGKGGRVLSVFPSSLGAGPNVFGKVYWRSQAGFCTVNDRWPSSNVILSVGMRNVLWMAFTQGVYREFGRYIVGYQPAPKGQKNWAGNDRWIGPFQTPARSNITRLVGDGKSGLLLSTSTGVYRVDCAEAVAQAERGGRVCSTAEWRKRYEKRLVEAGWQSLVPTLILEKRWDDALKLLDGRQKQLGPVTKASPRKNRDEWIRLQLWRAHVYAKKPGGVPKAIEAYGKVAGTPFVDHPAEVFARMNQILLLHKAKRWQEMLDSVQAVMEKFPQTKPQNERDRLRWYINDARRKLKKASDSKDSKVGP